GNVFILGYRYMGDLLSDQVLCTLQLSTCIVRFRTLFHSSCNFPDLSLQAHHDENFTDIIKYRLMLYVEVPEMSGIDVTHLISPIATLGCYEGHFSDFHTLKWTRMLPGIPVELQQPCNAMADVFAELA